MNQQEMSLILQDVRKAYRLLADYQQRIIELLDFIKNELEAEHYYHERVNNFAPKSIRKIYHDPNSGKKFLPMLDMHLLWHKTKEVPQGQGQRWQEYVQKNDLVFDIQIKSDDNEHSLLFIYVYQCIKYTRLVDWYNDVWENRKYQYPNELNTTKEYHSDDDKISYIIYSDCIDLSKLYNEEVTRKEIAEFRNRATSALGCAV